MTILAKFEIFYQRALYKKNVHLTIKKFRVRDRGTKKLPPKSFFLCVFPPLCLPRGRGRTLAQFYGKIRKKRVLLRWEGHMLSVSPPLGYGPVRYKNITRTCVTHRTTQHIHWYYTTTWNVSQVKAMLTCNCSHNEWYSDSVNYQDCGV